MPGPRFLIAGPYLNGGPPRAAASGRRIVRSPEETRRVIAYWASEGATWFKFLGARDPRRVGRGHQGSARARAQGHRTPLLRHVHRGGALGIDLLQHGFITEQRLRA